MKAGRATGPRHRGFTLIELIIAVVIVGILTAIALPSYRSHVVKANRTAAESFILSVANKQEQYILDTRAYATTLASLGASVPTDVAKNYTVAIPSTTTTPPGYTITATPIGNQLASDAACGSVSIDQAGTKSIGGTGTVAACW